MAQLKDTSVTGDLTITNDGTTINVKDEIDALNSKLIILKFALKYKYASGANVISITVPKDGYYLMIAYIKGGGAAWLDGITNADSYNYLKINAESSCSKILSKKAGDVVSLVNLNGSSCNYDQSSYLGLIELNGEFVNLNE